MSMEEMLDAQQKHSPLLSLFLQSSKTSHQWFPLKHLIQQWFIAGFCGNTETVLYKGFVAWGLKEAAG